MDAILTYDLGGSSLRVALYDFNGVLIGFQQKPLKIEQNLEGGCLEDPELWWATFYDLTSTLLRQVGTGSVAIRAVSGTGMTRSQIFLDRSGHPLFPAILWPDNRSEDESLILKKIAKGEKRWSPINEYHTLSRVLWFKKHYPELYRKVHYILEPKDYINFKLTGELAADVISLSRILKAPDLCLDLQLMHNAGISASLFPQLQWPWETMGLCQALPAPLDVLKGTPVATGSMDAWCSVTGTGAAGGDIYNVSGTSEVTGFISSEMMWRDGLVTLPWGEKLFQIGGPSQVGGDALQWLGDILLPGEENSVQIIAEKIGHYRRKKDAPLFIPYLRGERAPLWEKRARGVFWNLQREHVAEDLVYAVMEGVALATRYLLERIFENNPLQGQLVISGGAAKNDLWCRIKADILGVPVVRKNEAEAGLKGAFIVAMAGLREVAGIKEGQQKFIKPDRMFAPDAQMLAKYNKIYPIWKKASLEMLTLHREFSEIDTPQ